VQALLSAMMLTLAAVAPLAVAAGPAVPPRWVQYTVDGIPEARVVTGAPSCPSIILDGLGVPMRQRAAPNADFPDRICAAKLPPGTNRINVLDTALPSPVAAPQRIIVLGDTGCRLSAAAVQACNDPAAWPFAAIAERAAAMHPELVIHVGDYLYRESPCPRGDAACADSPWGDNWATWRADFFTPAEKLLTAAPWVMVRGNHEQCERAGRGWTRLTGPAPFDPQTPCRANEPPYVLSVERLTLIVMDDATAPDTTADDRLIAVYRADFDAVARLAHDPSWLLMHRPLRGIVRFAAGHAVGGSKTLLPALIPGFAPEIELLLSGHIHAFEAINYEAVSPPQLIVGNGGDILDNVPPDLSGIEVGGLRVTNGLTLPGFGFLLLTRAPQGWRAEAFDTAGTLIRRCVLAERRVACEPG
jgi:calcineurin-like phosphoesterase family protein